jgi:hypothetical protein
MTHAMTATHPESCFNYGKKPNPDDPDGPFIVDGWFDCERLKSTIVRKAYSDPKGGSEFDAP